MPAQAAQMVWLPAWWVNQLEQSTARAETLELYTLWLLITTVRYCTLVRRIGIDLLCARSFRTQHPGALIFLQMIKVER